MTKNSIGGCVNAQIIANALGGRKAGGAWIARCPAHDDRNPSLSIRDAADGTVLVHCHAGCEQTKVINALRVRGLWDMHNYKGFRIAEPQRRQPETRQTDSSDRRRMDAALRIWEATTEASDTPVETYLKSRGITIAPPPIVRYHAGLKHPTGSIWPALVALVTHSIDGAPVGIHRIFLSRDGTGKAPVAPQKMMLGPCGGGAVRLAPGRSDQWLVIAEGIETTLSVMQACGFPGWAALSANMIERLELPSGLNRILICADNDANGVGQRAGRLAAQRFLDEGRRVRIALPPIEGQDFNDLLLGSVSAPIKGGRHVA
jgi:putative DNA primase/helicase